MKSLKKIIPGAAALFYLLIALEVIIMITPFTAFFYSVYAPILNKLYNHHLTSWLTDFFLPHITFPNSPFLLALLILGPILFILGLLIFFICAGQVYYAKLAKRGVVTRGLYSLIRHPQYLGLAVSGLGLLLFWPRFFILVTYITMLFVYYLLARNEEWRMERAFPDAYRAYMTGRSMFLPGNPGGKIFSRFPGARTRKGLAIFLLYIFALAGGTGVAFLLREHTKSQLSLLYKNNLAVISMPRLGKARIEELTRIALTDLRASSRLSPAEELVGNESSATYVAYLMPADYMMAHLIAASVSDHEEHHGGKASGSKFVSVIRHLGGMLVLKPLRQLARVEDDEKIRIIFTRPLGPGGKKVSPEKVMGVSVRRMPLFFVDIDPRKREIDFLMETTPEHQWGDIPVPTF